MASTDNAPVIATVGQDKQCVLWRIADGAAKRVSCMRIREKYTYPMQRVFGLSNGHVITVDDGGSARVWDPATAKQTHLLPGEAYGLLCMAELPNGHIVTGGGGGVYVVSLPPDSPNGRLEAHWELGGLIAVRGIALTTGGLIVAVSEAGTITTIRPEDGSMVSQVSPGLAELVSAVALPGNRVAIGVQRHGPLILHCDSGDLVPLDEGLPFGRGMAVSPCGRWVYTGSNFASGCAVQVHCASTGARLRLLRGAKHIITGVASLSGGRVAAGSWDGSLRVWDGESGQEVAVLPKAVKSAKPMCGVEGVAHISPFTPPLGLARAQWRIRRWAVVLHRRQ